MRSGFGFALMIFFLLPQGTLASAGDLPGGAPVPGIPEGAEGAEAAEAAATAASGGPVPQACTDGAQKCAGAYKELVHRFSSGGCKGPKPEPPARYVSNHGDECYAMFKECPDQGDAAEKGMEGFYRDMLKKCGGTYGVTTAAEETADPGKGGPRPGTPAPTPVPTIPVIAKPRKVIFDLTFKVFLSGREECREKEEKAKAARKDATVGKGVDDSHFYCDRFYPPVDGLEGKTGNNPLEISNRIAESEKAGLRFGKVKASLEFETTEECVKEIRRLDGLYGNVIAFFGSYSKDLNEVCQAIRDDKIGALWQLQTGKKPRSVTGARR